MPDTSLQLTIAADTSAAAQGLAQLNSSLSGLVSQVGGLRTSFSALQGNVTALANSVATLAANLKSAGAQGGEGLSSLQKEGGGAATTLEGLTKNVSTLFKGAGEMASALKTAGSLGAEGLAAIGEGAGAAVEVIGAVVQIALSAADAMSQWAANTLKSNDATAEARQHASDLTNAISAAHTQFDALGNTLGNAFAPVMTTIVVGLTNLAKGFDDSYTKGGIAKTIVDVLALSVKALAGVVATLVTGWVLQFDAIKGAIFSAQAVWQGFVDSIVDRATEAWHQLWTLGKLAADALTGNVLQAAQDMKSGWATMQADAKKTATDAEQAAQRIRSAFMSNGGAEALGTFHGGVSVLSSLANDKSHAPAPTAAQKPGATPTQSKSGASSECPCDPAAAEACEQQAQAGRTSAATQADEARASSHAAANAAMTNSDGTTSDTYASNQAQQVAIAENADRAKVQSNNAANRSIAEANDKTLKQFEASMKKLVDTFADGLAKMAEGSESFGKLMRKVGQQILDDIVRVVIGMVEKWAWGVTEQVLASQRGQTLLQALGLKDLALEIAADAKKVASNAAANAAKVASNNSAAAAGQTAQLALTLTTLKQDAAKVFGGIFAALSSNPFTLPAAAPAAAAGAAAVMSFSVAAGGYDIPAGVNPLTQLHAQEMVLPARLANPMRDMLASFNSGDTSAPTGHSFSFGDTHIHGAPNMSPADFKQALAEHRANVAGAVADALRSGWRPSYRQPVGAL